MADTSIGKEFESWVDRMARHQGHVPLIIDRKPAFNHGVFRSAKAPFDRVLFKNGRAVAFDVKTINQKTFHKNLIKKDQLDAIMDVGQQIAAGYLIYFRPVNRVVFYNWQELFRIYTGPEASLKCDQGIYLGDIRAFSFQPIFDLR